MYSRNGKAVAETGKYLLKNKNTKVSDIYTKIWYKEYFKKGAIDIGAASVSNIAAISAIKSLNDKVDIKNYKIKHPNTKLNDAEILKVLKSNKRGGK